jgi:uncharacterized protein YjbI with pentapeptide repeats/DNA-binding Xre family transcriptional regulator
MTNLSQGRKKRKITYAASPQVVDKAEKALKRLGFESKINFAKSNLLSRSTVTKFFQCQPIQFDSLRRICEALTLDWQEIVQMCEEEQSNRLEIKESSNSDTNEGVEQVQTLSRKVIVLDKQTQVIKAVLILEGDFNSINNNFSLSLPAILREYAGDTIKITDIEEGSIRLIIEGSPEDIEQLISSFNSGELIEVSGFPVEDIQILSEGLDDDESNESNDKWRLVQEIVSQRVDTRNLSGADLMLAAVPANVHGANLSEVNFQGANLSDADLSDADLSEVNLRGANFQGADLSNADLSKVNLRGANLSDADLSDADLRGANLSDADLSDADLSGADLSDAGLSGADLRGARIDAQTKIDSKWRLAWEIVNQSARKRHLIGIDLRSADLRSANLHGAKLRSANLQGADLRSANLQGAKLSDADLRGADLRDANLRDADLWSANLRSANLQGANLRSADLRDADLRNADLRRAKLRGANLRSSYLRGADLRGADLRGADLRGADLRGADLSSAVVEEAQFGDNLGLTEEMKLDLKRRGAIFEDSPGGRIGFVQGWVRSLLKRIGV